MCSASNSDRPFLPILATGSQPLPKRLSTDFARSRLLRPSPLPAPACHSERPKEDAPGFLDQQKARAAGEAAEISNVGKMADQQRIEPGRGKVLPQFLSGAARKFIACLSLAGGKMRGR
jgi:hypothetical protein